MAGQSALSQGLANVFSYNSLVHAIAGATGGATAITIFFPLNQIRVRKQADDSTKNMSIFEVAQHIMAKDGVKALYKGLKAQIVCLATSNFVYFYTYNSLKVINSVISGEKSISPVKNLVVASIAGVINVLLTSPLWTICIQIMRSKEEREPGVMEQAQKMIDNEGFWSLWKGVIPSLWLVSNPTVQFLVYERLRILLSSVAAKRGTAISVFEFFIMGAVAKAAATYVTYPLQVAQTKLRSSGKTKKEDGEVDPNTVYSGTFDCLVKIGRKNGFWGYYQGINAKLLQTVLTAAFQFLTYEQIQLAVLGALGVDKTAGAMASSFVEKKKE